MNKNEMLTLYKKHMKKLMVDLDDESYFLYSSMRVYRDLKSLDNIYPIRYFVCVDGEDKKEMELSKSEIENLNEDYEIMTASQIVREVNMFLNSKL